MRTTGKQVAICSLLLTGSVLAQTPSPTAAPAAPPIKLPLTSLKPDVVIEVGAEARMVVTPDGAWVVNRATGAARKVDPKTSAFSASVEIGSGGKGPCQPVVSAFETLWVAFCDSKSLARFDPPVEKPPTDTPATEKPTTDKPTTDKPTIQKPSTEKPAEPKKGAGPVAVEIRSAGPLTTATGSIWMITDARGTLARIDPDTNAAVAEIQVPPGASAIASGMNAIWVTSSTNDSVTRVHAETNVVEEVIKVGKGPLSVAIGEGSVWTMNGGDSTVSRIDPKTNKVAETIKSGVAGAEGSIVAAEGSVWLSAPGIPLTRIDPATNRMVQQFTGPGGGRLAIGLKSLWLSATPTAIWRIDPKRVEATRK